MSALESLWGFFRTTQLSRQMWRIEKMVSTFDVSQRRKLAHALARELKGAAASPDPTRYQSTFRSANRPWGDGTAIAWARANSDNGEVQVCGIALWLAIAYHETRSVATPSSQSVHRRVIRIAREMREFLESPRREQRAGATFGERRATAGA